MNTQTEAGQGRRHVLPILFVCIALLWIASLAQRALFIPDEGRYADIARAMLASGDWVTPRLNDLKYFEKPPLQYWLTALGYQVFGVSNWSARLPPALLGLGCIALVCFTAGRLWGRRAALCALLVLSASWAFILSGAFLTLDMSLSALLGLALCSFLLAQQAASADRAGRPDRAARHWMMLAWLSIALAFLTRD